MLENKLVVAILIIIASWGASFIVTFIINIIEKFASESKNIRVAKVNADLNKKIIELD